MRRFELAVLLATIAGCAAQTQLQPRNPVVPLKVLRLYETGMAYFERSGALSDTATLPIPTSHLDDALKSLVVLSPGGATGFSGFDFPSTLSKDVALTVAGLPRDSGGAFSYADVLRSMEGASVEIGLAERLVSGRIVKVIAVDEASSSEKDSDENHGSERDQQGLVVVLLTPAGAVVRIQDSEIRYAKPLDLGFATRFNAVLDALPDRSAQAQRWLRAHASGKDAITFGYIAETPVWRTTYRLVLDDKGETSLLQGWALLHNNTDEDWIDLEAHLMSGRPHSFLYALATPRYRTRDIEEPAEDLTTTPQLLDKTVDDMLVSGESGLDELGGIGGGGGMSYGVGGGIAARPDGETSSSLLNIGNLAQTQEANTKELLTLFDFQLPTPLSLPAHYSMLVPFVEQTLSAKRLSLIASNEGFFDSKFQEQPVAAIEIKNTSHTTMPLGPMALYSAAGFEGEAPLPRFKPGETRYVAFGLDLDVEVKMLSSHTKPEETKRVTFDAASTSLKIHRIKSRNALFHLKNRSGLERRVCLSFAAQENTEATGWDEAVFDPDSSRAVVCARVPPSETLGKELKVRSAVQSSIDMSSGDIKSPMAEQIQKVLAAKGLAQTERDVLQGAIPILKESDKLLAKKTRLQREAVEVERRIDRLKTFFKGEKPDSALASLGKRILDMEDKLAQIAKAEQAIAEQLEPIVERLTAQLEKLPPTDISDAPDQE